MNVRARGDQYREVLDERPWSDGWPMTAETPAVEAAMEEFSALWDGDFSAADVLAESVVMRLPGTGEVRGREAVEHTIRDLRTAFPDLDVTADELLASGGTVMLEWTMTGTHEGEYMGTPPTGREIEVVGMEKILIEDGAVREDRIYFDSQAVMEQLEPADGAEPGPKTTTSDGQEPDPATTTSDGRRR